ncbi:hypothetical protein [Brucella intermedia]|uniref:hypothetical protein n=1 Tax=Brucella intermedia TaxID=94625 RepID=UPI0015CD068F|nr:MULTISPECIES: hypothetical protein [Brucella/Ochrobactrum group]MBA8846232.1 hypothetical protein [Ochrobactrum sp. RH1CCR137]MBA8858051.1 hypothetical protein [Ochrobactrum sp. RH1CCR134]NYD82093.1 hypothetical protein [Brucella intermedia]
MRHEPANKIINEFGGLTAVATIVGVSPHSVMRWRMPKQSGGTGGAIPHWHIPVLLAAAKDRKLKLRPEDFVSLNAAVRSPKVARAKAVSETSSLSGTV